MTAESDVQHQHLMRNGAFKNDERDTNKYVIRVRVKLLTASL